MKPKDIHAIDPRLLLNAYASGIFPMAESAADAEVFWVKPETRGIIPLDDFHIPRSVARTIKRGTFEIRVNSAFSAVIAGCAETTNDRPATWINASIRDACQKLHVMGHAHSVEAWKDGELAGGLYGVSLGRAFFGESMFSRVRDASKICLVHLVERMRERDFTLLDTQFTTEHLKRFGAVDISRKRYERLLQQALEGEAPSFA